MKKILLLLVVVLFYSCENEDFKEPPKKNALLKFANNIYDTDFTEISFQGHKFKLDSRYQTFVVDTEILDKVGEVDIICSYRWANYPYKIRTKAVFVRGRTTKLTAYVEDQRYTKIEVTYP